jgi:hypothetical protein
MAVAVAATAAAAAPAPNHQWWPHRRQRFQVGNIRCDFCQGMCHMAKDCCSPVGECEDVRPGTGALRGWGRGVSSADVSVGTGVGDTAVVSSALAVGTEAQLAALLRSSSSSISCQALQCVKLWAASSQSWLTLCLPCVQTLAIVTACGIRTHCLLITWCPAGRLYKRRFAQRDSKSSRARSCYECRWLDLFSVRSWLLRLPWLCSKACFVQMPAASALHHCSSARPTNNLAANHGSRQSGFRRRYDWLQDCLLNDIVLMHLLLWQPQPLRPTMWVSVSLRHTCAAESATLTVCQQPIMPYYEHELPCNLAIQ